MTDPDTQVSPGQILAGKYRIEQVLGKGGMGVVVAATHVQLDQRVALKFLLPEALNNAEAVKRFEREARAAVKIKSEHVARVTDVGTLETGSPYMVMEYLSGLDLGQYVERQGALEPAEAAEYLLQACEAIAEAHSLGIIHRDLKPANLFRIMRADGTPSIKVLDFGISKVIAEGSMTQTSSMMGSPYYMSPEQMTSARTVDARTDVWALGIIFHELLTGRVPYEGETIPEICVQILHAEPPSLLSIRPDLSADLDQVIRRALAKDREERYPDVAALARDLAPFAPKTGRISSERISRVLGVANTLSPPGDPPAGARGKLETSADPAAKTTLAGAAHTQLGTGVRSKLPAIVLGIALLAALGVGTIIFLGGTDGGTDAAAEVAAVPEDQVGPAPEVVQAPVPASRSQGDEPKEPRAEETKPKEPKAEETKPKEPKATEPEPAERGKSADTAAGLAPSPAPAPRVAPPPRPVAPKPAPRPAPAPAPQPSPRDLFMDRK